MGSNLTNKIPTRLSNLTCRVDDFSPEILKIIKGQHKDELYSKFVKKFLKYIPVDYRSKEKIETFKNFTDEAYEFFKKTDENISRRIELINCYYENNPAITILISCKNKPFIMDSLSSLLSNLSIFIMFAFHPIIHTVRDAKGSLTNILDKAGDTSVSETLIYLKILGSFDNKAKEKLEYDIIKILDLVDYTYDSWQILLDKIINISTDIVHNIDSYAIYKNQYEDGLDFLNWIQKNNFTFLGTVDFDIKEKKIIKEGGVQEIWQDKYEEIDTIIDLSQSDYYAGKIIMLGKLNKISPVHRNALVDYILIKNLDLNGNYIGGTIIFGLYGTAMYFQSITTVPILRGKMNYVLETSEFPANGYNAKKLKNIIESLPRDILIQIDEDDLYCMCLHMLSSMRSRKLKIFVQQDWSKSFINIIIFLPRDRLTPEIHKEINNYLAGKFGNKIIADNITVVAQDFAHQFLTLAITDVSKLEFDQTKLEKDLEVITTDWSESLLQKFCTEYGEYEGGLRFKKISPSFPQEYKHKFDSLTTYEDINYLELATQTNRLHTNFVEKNNNEFYLKFYSPHSSLTLSDLLPSIENLGFIVHDEQSFLIKESHYFKEIWLYEFKLTGNVSDNLNFQELKYNIEDALLRINQGELLADNLCKLIVLSGFNWLHVRLVKAFCKYMHQTGFVYGKEYTQQVLIKHYKYAELLIEYFKYKFSPDECSLLNAEKIAENMHSYLESVETSSEDKVLNNIYLVVAAITRTNFYQKDKNENPKSYISFKFDSKSVPDLQLPIPYAEIFVYSNNFEGCHLRGGKVARGGIRWSDRGEDYRTEVLGLMKAQMTKNTVIVPVGSKGAFFVNISQSNISREEYMNKVVESYQNFLRGLLDITDNIIDSKIIKPENSITYDEDDPYLVVAADKGTASFSDYANAISLEYNFWLRDAFASGGSAGYDHKKMGITAKGAWISAKSHFRDKGIDIQTEPITVAGIGDMSGDVFGNGMLLSNSIKLVAAFNHIQIFIDPDPEPYTSFEERKRLFEMPRSKWSDYNKELISKGGGVFERSSKIISLTPEIKNLLSILQDKVTPDELIRSILKANVDLIWNGGIGTYIKSSLENNIEIGDKSNDLLRANGNEVRAKVIVEGGNLGISQLGRVEYAKLGGVINTDFIDNSAGVDCSDHEVNIKIALNSAVSKGKITLEERNELLASMTSQVEELVLLDNADQNLAITILSLSPYLSIEAISQLIKELEESGLDREVEFLPSKAELSRRMIAREGMTRAELAILLSYSKMSLDIDLSNSLLTNDEYFEKHLVEYFPVMMRDRFKEEILNHPLKEDIIKTIITNKMVNQLGGSALSSIKKESGCMACDAARGYEVVTEIFNLQYLWDQVSALGTTVPTKIKIEMLADLGKIMRRGISWFVRNIAPPINITENIQEFQYQSEELANMIDKLLVGNNKTNFINKIQYYSDNGVDKQLARAIASLEVSVSAFDIIFIAKKTNYDNKIIADLYFECGDYLDIDWLRTTCEAQINDSYWNRLSVQALKDDFYDKQRRLVEFIALTDSSVSVKKWLEDNGNASKIFINFVNEIKMQDNININMLILANKKLEIFLRKIGVNR